MLNIGPANYPGGWIALFIMIIHLPPAAKVKEEEKTSAVSCVWHSQNTSDGALSFQFITQMPSEVGPWLPCQCAVQQKEQIMIHHYVFFFFSCFVLKGYVPCLPSSNSTHTTISQKLITFNPSISGQLVWRLRQRLHTHKKKTWKKKKNLPQEIITRTGLLPGGCVLCPSCEEVQQAVKLL